MLSSIFIHWAAKYGHTEIVKILIEVTANPNTPNKSGMTPHELARRKHFFDIIKLLEPYVSS